MFQLQKCQMHFWNPEYFSQQAMSATLSFLVGTRTTSRRHKETRFVPPLHSSGTVRWDKGCGFASVGCQASFFHSFSLFQLWKLLVMVTSKWLPDVLQEPLAKWHCQKECHFSYLLLNRGKYIWVTTDLLIIQKTNTRTSEFLALSVVKLKLIYLWRKTTNLCEVWK